MTGDINCKTVNSQLNSPLNLAVLYVCGLKTHSLNPEFQDLIYEYVMFCVTETKLDSTDIISVNGYTFRSQSRKRRYIRKSGGIGVFVKDSMNKYVELLETDSDYVFWLKLCKKYLKSNHNIIVGVVYVPPTQSKFFNEDEFELFQSEITKFCSEHDYVYLCGDINAQTGELSDYITDDKFLNRYFLF